MLLLALLLLTLGGAALAQQAPATPPPATPKPGARPRAQRPTEEVPIGAGLRIARARTTEVDTTQQRADSLAAAAKAKQTDSLRAQSSIASRMKFRADDSITLRLDTAQTMRLYGKAKLDHDNRKVDAARIAIQIDSGLVRAQGVADSTGTKFTGEPIFYEGSQKFDTRSIAYNFKTRKGTIEYTRTKQGESYVIASRSKRVPDGSFFNADNKFTTCSDEEPHFYLRANRIKFLPNNKVVTGPFYMAMADIPLPLVLPFGFFPASNKRSSGLIFPAFGEDANRGFNLRNGGYYFVINDHWDARITGDIYARGSFRVQTVLNYNTQYKYRGTFSYDYASNRFGDRDDPDFNQTNAWFITWQHQQTIDPNTRFTANVNAGASTFLRTATFSLNNIVTNQLQSSISLTKQFPRAGWTLSLAANHSQNTQNRQVSLSAPNLNIAKNERIFPFRFGEPRAVPRWYETIGINYGAQIVGRVTVSERNFGTPAMADSFYYGMQHTAGMNTNFTLLRYLTVTPAISYTEWWYPRRSEPSFVNLSPLDRSSFGLDTTVTQFGPEGRAISGIVFTDRPGFSSARAARFSLGLNTRVYGQMQFRGRSRAALRHVLIPSVGYSYVPDYGDPRLGFYRDLPTNVERTQRQRYSIFTGPAFVFGGPGQGLTSAMTFSLNNTLELKYLSKEEREKNEGAKLKFTYLKLLDDLNISASYNFAADSFRLSTIPITARTSAFNNLLNVQANATLEPYAFTPQGRRINELQITRNGQLGTITSANVSVGLNLRPAGSDKKTAEKAKRVARREQGEAEPPAGSTLAAETDAEADSVDLTPLERFRRLYVDLDIPWSFNINYNWIYTNQPGVGASFGPRVTQTLNFSANVELTKKWRISAMSGYDFQNRGFSFTTFMISRDLHCWELRFSGSPFGAFRSYFLEIQVKASMLQDLRLQKRRDWQDTVLGPVNVIR